MKTEDLVAKLKSCDENTAKEFLYKYTPLIIYVITPILKNEEDREDCISDVIFKVWKSISTYDSAKGNFTGWLTAISRNTALNYQKKIIHTENIEDFQNTLISSDLTPEESLISNENKQIILRAINSLPTKDRILFYRKYYYFQPTSQIARETGLTERAVEGRLHRAKKRLRKMLGGDGLE